MSTARVVEAVLRSEDTGGPTPWGFGINCTSLEALPKLLQDAQNVAKEVKAVGRRPWLILYPNRGDVYDPTTQTWRQPGYSKVGLHWAHELREAVLLASEGIWDGFVCMRISQPT